MINATTTKVPAPWVNGHVIAEDAPVGVQLWPTRAPEYAPNFTISEVHIVRNHRGTHVQWVYESGQVRYLNPGDEVFVCTERPLS